MKALVTGGAGFIGSHVAEGLLSRGDEVLVMDNFSSGRESNLPRQCRVIAGHAERPSDWPRGDSFDVIIHLAARPSVGESWEHPLAAHHDNLSSLLCAIQMAKELFVPRIVFASSASVYGCATVVPIKEDCCDKPMSPYGFQKLSAETYLRLYAEKAGLSAVCLRFFNVFGERQHAASEYSGVISKFSAAAMTDSPITIFGDGLQTRDFIHVSDVARAVLAAADVNLPTGAVYSLNVGTGCETSLLSLVDHLRELTGSELPIRFTPRASGDIVRSAASIERAEYAIGFRSRILLREGLERYLQWLRTANEV